MNLGRTYYFADWFFIILGAMAYSFGVAAFLQPLEISPGGVTGVAAVINHLTGFPTGLGLFLLNLPLLVTGAVKLGWRLIGKTLISTALGSIFIDTFRAVIPRLTDDKVIASLAAGVFIGSGIGLLFLHGSTSGGTDIAAKLIRRKYPHFPLGRAILLIDGVVIGLAVMVYGQLESGLYAVLCILVSTTIIDKVLTSHSGGKVAFIITEKPNEVKQKILDILGRGLSETRVFGGYSGRGQTMLICALGRGQSGELVRLVDLADKNAFIIISDADDIRGKGFYHSY